MKQWPANDKPASFEDLIKPFKQSFRFAYKMHRQNQGKDIPYSGYEHNALHVCQPMKVRFLAENMQYDKEDQGRDALEVLIGAVLQIGIEQGRRIAIESSEVQTLRAMASLGELCLTKQD